jgi:hypothetical protein
MSAVDLSAQLGHLARRLQQANTALWHALVSEETTSPQFAVLNAVVDAENADQRTVGERIGLDDRGDRDPAGGPRPVEASP